MDDRQMLVLRRTADIVRSAAYLRLQRDSLLYECVCSKIPVKLIAANTNLSEHYINRCVRDFGARLEEAS